MSFEWLRAEGVERNRGQHPGKEARVSRKPQGAFCLWFLVFPNRIHENLLRYPVRLAC